MLKGKKILIVDDNDINIFALSASLKRKGPLIAIAKDGQECLNYLKDNPEIDLVLLDMMMPVMDGYQTLAVMRNNDKLKNIPVIALTAQAMLGDSEKCLSAGADDYCSKPINIETLLNKIYTLLHIEA